MNIAFSVIVLFVLLLPGLFFWLFLTSIPVGRVIKTFTKRAVFVFVTALILNIIWWALSSLVLRHKIHFGIIIHLLSGTGQHYQQALDIVAKHLIAISIYFLSLYLISGLLGCFFRWLIKYFDLERKHDFFRFIENDWYYLLSGYDVDKTLGLMSITAVVEQCGEAYLYSGILKNFYFDRNGNLDFFVLQYPFRRKLSHDKKDRLESGNGDIYTASNLPEDSRFYPIISDTFILKYAVIKNLNLYMYE